MSDYLAMFLGVIAGGTPPMPIVLSSRELENNDLWKLCMLQQTNRFWAAIHKPVIDVTPSFLKDAKQRMIYHPSVKKIHGSNDIEDHDIIRHQQFYRVAHFANCNLLNCDPLHGLLSGSLGHSNCWKCTSSDTGLVTARGNDLSEGVM